MNKVPIIIEIFVKLQVIEERRMWHSEGQVGGFVKRFAANFLFLVIMFLF